VWHNQSGAIVSFTTKSSKVVFSFPSRKAVIVQGGTYDLLFLVASDHLNLGSNKKHEIVGPVHIPIKIINSLQGQHRVFSNGS
jgi:hypothetical protein